VIVLRYPEWHANLMTIPRVLIRLMIGLWLLLAAVVALIRLQPFDDGGLRALVMPTNCPTPCFMGIRPGLTSAAEAHDRLEKQGLVYQWLDPLLPIDQQAEDVSFAPLRWRWNGNRPTLLTGVDGSLIYDRKTGLVISLGSMATNLTWGNVLVDLGQPAVGFMSAGINDRDRPIFTHAAGYPHWHFDAVSTIQCPMTLQQLWDAPVTLEIGNAMDEDSRFRTYPHHIEGILEFAASGFC